MPENKKNFTKLFTISQVLVWSYYFLFLFIWQTNFMAADLALIRTAFRITADIALVYIHGLFIFNILVERKNVIRYSVCAILLVMIYGFFLAYSYIWVSEYYNLENTGGRLMFVFPFFMGILMLGISAAVKFSFDYFRNQETLQSQERILRQEIGRDFHDQLGNQTARLINYVGLLKIQGKITSDVYTDLTFFSKGILNGTKDFIWTLDPINDYTEKIILHIKDFAERIFTEKNISFRFHGVIKAYPVDRGASRQILMIFQEAVTNAFRHSGATEVVMTVDFHPSEYSITLKDNGKGFEYSAIVESNRGLDNMNFRARKIGGNLTIISNEGGTEIILTLPL